MLTMDIRKFIQDENIEVIDVRYTSLEGRLRSINFPAKRLDYFIEKGIGVDGSSLGKKEQKGTLEEVPCNLLEAANALMEDKDFLTRDGIFPEWILDRWCDAKRKEFWDIESRPSAIEFIRYFSP